MGAFEKLRKATISFVTSVCLSVSVCMSIRPHGTSRLKRDGFSLNLILERFGEICQENLIFIKTGTLNEDLRTFMIISHSGFLRMRNVSEKSCGEHQNVSTIMIFPKIVPFMR